MAVTTSTRMGVTLWSADTDAFTRSQMNNSHESIELVGARFTAGTVNPPLPDSQYERAFFYNTTESQLYFSPSGVAWRNVVADVDVATVDGTETLTNKTFVSPVINEIVTPGGTMTLPSGTDTLVGQFSGQILFNKSVRDSTLTNSTLRSPIESWNVISGSAGGALTINYQDGAGHVWTSNTTSNITINLRGDASTSLFDLMPTATAITLVTIFPMGATPYYVTSFSIDGAAQTVYWAGEDEPTSGNSNSSEMYFWTVVSKSGSSPDFDVFAQRVQYA